MMIMKGMEVFFTTAWYATTYHLPLDVVQHACIPCGASLDAFRCEATWHLEIAL